MAIKNCGVAEIYQRNEIITLTNQLPFVQIAMTQNILLVSNTMRYFAKAIQNCSSQIG